MSKFLLHFFPGIVLISFSAASIAAVVNITASYSPSLADPGNNRFINTTPQSGYCVTVPEYCTDGVFSLRMGGISASLATSGLTANSSPRMGVYFKMPSSWRDVQLYNDITGKKETLKFRISSLSAQYNTPSRWSYDQHTSVWNGGSFIYPPSPCVSTGLGTLSTTYYLFLWKWPNTDAACYKTAKKDLPGEPSSITNISFSYELQTPEPLKMNSGTYSGFLSLSVGPGGDIDFGDSYHASDSELQINFKLAVNHELKITTTSENHKVSLQPCSLGRICSDDEGQANWERWMITRITPQLTGQSNFDLSSSGAFTVYLECEQQIGSDCALKSDKMPSQKIPIQTLLTLPNNIVDYNTGLSVSKQRLQVGFNSNKNIFSTKSFGQNKRGTIDFLINQKEVDMMLSTRPDQYRGAITIVFEPELF